MTTAANDEKSYEQSIAADLFNMIQAAKKQGLDLSRGFQNEPLATRQFALRYLFQDKRTLSNMPGIPASLRKKLRKSNVLAAILTGGKMTGAHLICATDTPFHKITTEDQLLAAIDPIALAAYADQVREALTNDFHQATTPDHNPN